MATKDRPKSQQNDSIYLAIYTDDLYVKVWVNYRSASGEMKEGVYKAILLKNYPIVMILRFILRKLEKLSAKYVFIYSNDTGLSFLSPLKPKTDQDYYCVADLTKYLARDGGWNFFAVQPEAIQKAANLQATEQRCKAE